MKMKIQPRIWATNLSADEPYDIVVLLDGVLYESPGTFLRREFAQASANCLQTELTEQFVKDNWTHTGYNELAFNQAVQDWENQDAHC